MRPDEPPGSDKPGLVGHELLLEVSEPWEVAEATGRRRRVRVIRVGSDASEQARDALLLELDPPLEHRGTAYRTFVATPRYRDTPARALVVAGEMEANLYGIEGDEIPPDPFGLTWWRGGLGMTGLLSRAGGASADRTYNP